MTTTISTKKRSTRMKDLFFFRRRPRLRGVPVDWEQPNEAEFQQVLEYDGFVSRSAWERYGIKEQSVIAQDLRDLEQHLMPTFYQFSQRAKHFQNRYYLYQWVFIWGAFLTTLFGTLTTYVYPISFQDADTAAVSAPADGETVDATAQISRNNTPLAQIFGYLTAIVGAVTAFYTSLSNRGEPQKRWAKNRRLAEELRMHYYKYLAHMTPYDKPDRVQRLRETVIDARIKEQENVN